MEHSGLPLLGASESISLDVAHKREPRQRGQTWFPVPMQEWYGRAIRGKEKKPVRSRITKTKEGPGERKAVPSGGSESGTGSLR